VAVTFVATPGPTNLPVSGVEVLLYPAGPCAAGDSTCTTVLGLYDLSLFLHPPAPCDEQLLDSDLCVPLFVVDSPPPSAT
jgi:hypothetical protein